MDFSIREDDFVRLCELMGQGDTTEALRLIIKMGRLSSMYQGYLMDLRSSVDDNISKIDEMKRRGE